MSVRRRCASAWLTRFGVAQVPSAGKLAPLPRLDSRLQAYTVRRWLDAPVTRQPDLGPIALTFVAEVLIVAGLLAYRIDLPAPTASQTIETTLVIEQAYTIKPLGRSDQVFEPSPAQHVLETRSVSIVAGEEVCIQRVVRLPAGKFKQSVTSIDPADDQVRLGARAGVYAAWHQYAVSDRAQGALA